MWSWCPYIALAYTAIHSALLLIRLQMKAGGIIAIAKRPTPLGDTPYKK